jgi:hypothetical protein
VYLSQFFAKRGVGRAQLGFLDILEPLDSSIFHYENFKELILILSSYNENDPPEDGLVDVAQERGELLYHFVVLCACFDGCL